MRNREENRKHVLKKLEEMGIHFRIYEHPPLDTIDIAQDYWKDIDAMHFKNLFFRNHKGKQHYLVIIKDTAPFNIHKLEKTLKQGKLSFASEKRLEKYLGVKPGSVSPFGLLNDIDKHVKIFIDKQLQNAEFVSFHPNDNTASLVLTHDDFIKFLTSTGNNFEYFTP